ncbi:hypothetical protein BDV93DRAFT_454442 [Ceratobasidium sp. AG-I]|nr:hypothetical protein BDV93DRAFT_454442 [Ceratobasidium sp. AG-I]
MPPDKTGVQDALLALELRLKPPRKSGVGHIDPKIDLYTLEHLLAIAVLFRFFLDDELGLGWIKASMLAAKAFGKRSHHARSLRSWARVLIDDHAANFANPYGNSIHSALDDEDFQEGLFLYLQRCGRDVKADDVVQYTARPDVLAQLERSKPISLSTAQHWMSILGFRFGHPVKGLYRDGHEREDVIAYRQQVYLPALAKFQERSRVYGYDGLEIVSVKSTPTVPLRPLIIWTHDESTYIQNDQAQLIWNSPTPVNYPEPKGNGQTVMVSDFVSAERGFLTSPDGKTVARVLFEAGKNREGYFTNANILAQTSAAMDILTKYYPDEDHVFIFDNATTHTKRSTNALSVASMTKNPPKNHNFLVDITGADGKVTQGLLTGARLPDGSPQNLYWPPGHAQGRPTEWWFKGTAQILFERGFKNAFSLLAVCPDNRHDLTVTNCCCRRALYNQPDFKQQKSALEELVETRGFSFLLLPKYHCELYPIEQCWGASKKAFRGYGIAKSLSEMRVNVIKSLDNIDIVQIRRFFNRANRFADGYRKELNGAQSGWAMKKYHSHRVFPEHILKEAQNAGIY